MVKVITREVIKMIMFAIIWAVPIVTALVFHSRWYLLLFIISIVVTAGIFRHYEDLEEMDYHFGIQKKYE